MPQLHVDITTIAYLSQLDSTVDNVCFENQQAGSSGQKTVVVT